MEKVNTLTTAVWSALVIIGMPRIAVAQPNVVELTAQRIAEGYANGEFTAVELTREFLDRIDAFEPHYNAFISVDRNAISVAEQLDHELATRGPRGPLHGVPIVIKESFDVAGEPITFGFAGFSSQAGGVDIIPSADASVVARLKDAGAIILGRTNLPAFGLSRTRTNDRFSPSWDGTTYNAYDRSLAPGASSSGTATAVAASLGVLGLGAESGGSIQNPSGAQSLVGVKPTYGLVRNAVGFSISGSTRLVAGPMAKTVYDAALALDVMVGTAEVPRYTNGLSTSALDGKRIGIYGPSWRNELPSPETQSLYESALEVLRTEGAELIEDPFAGTGFRDLAEDVEGFGDLRGMESAVFDVEKYFDHIFPNAEGTALEQLTEETGVDLFALNGELNFFVDVFDVAAASLEDPDASPDLSEFESLKSEYLEILQQVMEEKDLDALVYPQTLEQIPVVDGLGEIIASTVSEINIMGTPGVTVPGGYYASGAPFSLIFHGDLFSEADLLAYAYDYEQATSHRVAPDLLHVADINQDGAVDLADFLVLSNNFGKRRSSTRRGDLNADRIVDFADFLILSKSFGYGAPPPENVPEPSSLLLCILGVAGCRRSRRRLPTTARSRTKGDAVWGEGDLDPNGKVYFADLLALGANFGGERVLRTLL